MWVWEPREVVDAAMLARPSGRLGRDADGAAAHRHLRGPAHRGEPAGRAHRAASERHAGRVLDPLAGVPRFTVSRSVSPAVADALVLRRDDVVGEVEEAVTGGGGSDGSHGDSAPAAVEA